MTLGEWLAKEATFADAPVIILCAVALVAFVWGAMFLVLWRPAIDEESD